MKKFTKYMYNTKENKLASIIMVGFSIPSAIIGDDATFLIFALLIGIPIFFMKKRVIF